MISSLPAWIPNRPGSGSLERFSYLDPVKVKKSHVASNVTLPTHAGFLGVTFQGKSPGV